jgi:hypothetical protein
LIACHISRVVRRAAASSVVTTVCDSSYHSTKIPVLKTICSILCPHERVTHTHLLCTPRLRRPRLLQRGKHRRARECRGGRSITAPLPHRLLQRGKHRRVRECRGGGSITAPLPHSSVCYFRPLICHLQGSSVQARACTTPISDLRGSWPQKRRKYTANKSTP